MLHKPAGPSGKDPAAEYKARLGVWMFLIYCVVYAGFVALNIISPNLMERAVLWDLNLAIIYGMGLIFFALILAFIYDLACRRRETSEAGKYSHTESC